MTTRRLTITGLLVVIAVFCGVCLYLLSGRPPKPCTGRVTIAVEFDRNDTPVFLWEPPCLVHELSVVRAATRVLREGKAVLWRVSAGLDIIPPSVRYGDPPRSLRVIRKLESEADLTSAAVVEGDGVLEPGRKYRVRVFAGREAVGETFFTARGEVLPGTVASIKAESIAVAVELYIAHTEGRLTNDFDLKKLTISADNGGSPRGPYLEKSELIDPWGNPFKIVVPGNVDYDFDIVSAGADGTMGTKDDIVG